MSRADDRQRAQAADEADRIAHERPAEPPEPYSADRRAWTSRCAGTRDGRHYRARVEADGSWRCQWCWHCFDPPAPFAGVRWTLCHAVIDLKTPLGYDRRRGRGPQFVYECPSCRTLHRRAVTLFLAREPLPEGGTMVCGAQIPKQGAA